MNAIDRPEAAAAGLPALIVHGGVGHLPEHELPIRLASLEEAALEGHAIFGSGGSALDAAVRAVVVLEDAPLLNAGYDCCLNLEGEAEHDASIMDSSGLCAGVGSVRGVRNPVLLARAVAERTDHRLVVGRGAERLAQLLALELGSSVTPRAEQRYGELMGRLQRIGNYATDAGEGFAWRKLPDLLELYGIARGLVAPLALPPPEGIGEPHSTVGAVAADVHGGLAAATSTGGIWLKLPGRVGDSAVVGAGTYCNAAAAASATGAGDEDPANRPVPQGCRGRGRLSGRRTARGSRCPRPRLDRRRGVRPDPPRGGRPLGRATQLPAHASRLGRRPGASGPKRVLRPGARLSAGPFPRLRAPRGWPRSVSAVSGLATGSTRRPDASRETRPLTDGSPCRALDDPRIESPT